MFACRLMDGLTGLRKSAAGRRRMRRLAVVAGGMAAAGMMAGGASWQRRHPRDPKGRFRDTPNLMGRSGQIVGLGGRVGRPDALMPAAVGSSKDVSVRDVGRLPHISRREFERRYPQLDFDGRAASTHGFSDSDQDQVRAAFHHFAGAYPEVAKRVKHVVLHPYLDSMGLCQVQGRGGDLEFAVLLNPKMLSGERAHALSSGKYLSSVEKNEPPWLDAVRPAAGASFVERVTLHELGHATHFVAAAGRLGGRAGVFDGEASVSGFGTVKYSDRDRYYPGRTVDEAWRWCEPYWEGTVERYESSRYKSEEVVSRYALRDPAEWFAENFSAWMTQRHRPDLSVGHIHPEFDRLMVEVDGAVKRWDVHVRTNVRKRRPAVTSSRGVPSDLHKKTLRLLDWESLCDGLLPEHGRKRPRR